MNILEVYNIHTYYGDVQVLRGVSLCVATGSIVAVLGRNGAGKTTLVRSIMGLNPIRRGRILYKGAQISGLPVHRIARLNISLVPQGHRIFPSLTVEENLRVAQRPRKNSNWDLERVFHVFPQIKARISHRGAALSGGEQQMLSVARSLLANPDLLLMDEMSEGLAPVLLREMEQIIRLLKEQGLSIILVEQKIPFAFRLADYVYVMSRGSIVHESLPQGVWEDNVLRSRYLGV